MSLHIKAFTSPSLEYKKKAKAWNACIVADVDPPDELAEYFDDFEFEGDPDPENAEVNIRDCLTQRHEKMEDGFDIDVTNLPKGITTIRIIYSH